MILLLAKGVGMGGTSVGSGPGGAQVSTLPLTGVGQ